jgi:iron-sulfur cluster repair protein YtfE (RIC family)
MSDAMIKQALGRVKTASKVMTRMDLDGLDLLRSDHMKVEALLLQLRIRRDDVARMNLLRHIQSDLELHMRIEEEIFYPECARHEQLHDVVEQSFQDHDEVRKQIAELLTIRPSSKKFSSLVGEVIRNIERHVMTEENEVFPEIRDVMDDLSFRRMSREMIRMHDAQEVTPKRRTSRRRAA